MGVLAPMTDVLKVRVTGADGLVRHPGAGRPGQELAFNRHQGVAAVDAVNRFGLGTRVVINVTGENVGEAL
jgi:hypothetical protein